MRAMAKTVESANEKTISGRVLLVDDCPTTRRITGKMISLAGLQVTTAENGRDAVDIAWLACNQEYGFDLVLMDLDMPVMGGLEATKLLRRIGFDKPIVAVSASTEHGIEQQCMAAGFNEFVSKPYQMWQLHGVLQWYLSDDFLRAA